MDKLVTCIRCGSTEWKVTEDKQHIVHVRCANCDLEYGVIHAEKEANSK